MINITSYAELSRDCTPTCPMPTQDQEQILTRRRFHHRVMKELMEKHGDPEVAQSKENMDNGCPVTQRKIYSASEITPSPTPKSTLYDLMKLQIDDEIYRAQGFIPKEPRDKREPTPFGLELTEQEYPARKLKEYKKEEKKKNDGYYSFQYCKQRPGRRGLHKRWSFISL